MEGHEPRDRADLATALGAALRQFGKLSLDGGLLAQVTSEACDPTYQLARLRDAHRQTESVHWRDAGLDAYRREGAGCRELTTDKGGALLPYGLSIVVFSWDDL